MADSKSLVHIRIQSPRGVMVDRRSLLRLILDVIHELILGLMPLIGLDIRSVGFNDVFESLQALLCSADCQAHSIGNGLEVDLRRNEGKTLDKRNTSDDVGYSPSGLGRGDLSGRAREGGRFHQRRQRLWLAFSLLGKTFWR